MHPLPSLPTGIWHHAPRFAALHIIAVIGGGLALDAAFGWPGQIAAILWTLAVFLWLYRHGTSTERRVLVLCTLIAGIGEVVLSLVWGLYDYQFQNIPLFVPPGHALLMTLGLLVTQQFARPEKQISPLPNKARSQQWRGVWRMTPWIAASYAGFAWISGFDPFGAVLFLLYAACMLFGQARILYSTMFVLALLMELYGTALGNWSWRPTVPGLGLHSANPPFSAGAFYCALDLLVLAALHYWPARTQSQSV